MKKDPLPEKLPVCGIAERARYQKAYEVLRPAYEKTLQSLANEIRRLLESKGYSPTIKYRIKRFDAYFDKLLRLSRQAKEEEALPELTDLLGIRIVCPFLEDVEAVEKILAEQLMVVEFEWKGASHSFREFGYDSVHLLIPLEPAQLEDMLPHSARVCEIQLRTILQDAWAEVEHELIYKSDISLPNDSIKRKLASLNATLSLSDLIFQEIRDYQKDIRERDRKRRQSVNDSFGEPHGGSLGSGLPSPGEVPLELVSLTGQRKLEKLMLDALDAHSRGELDRAIELYSHTLRLKLTDSVRSLVYNHRGMAHFGLSDYTQSIRDFSRAIFFDGNNTRCYNNRGLAFRVIKSLDKSLADYDRSLAINPSQVEGYWGRAQTCYAMQLYTQALADCESALTIQPDFLPANSLVARINSQLF